MAIATHYDVLGVPHDSSADAIRIAYRERARLHHPDRAATRGDSEVMSSLNEAYRVLGDPGRRALYDRTLLSEQASVSAEPPSDEPIPQADREQRFSVLSPPGPARVPWKLMIVMAVLGSAVVLVAAAFNDPPSEEPPDGIMRTGSCVAIELNGDAREVACTGDGDIVVELFIPVGGLCPAGAVAHRDRLGLGMVCISG